MGKQIFRSWICRDGKRRKSLTHLKIIFGNQLVFFPIISCHNYKLCARFQFASCTLAKRWCIHQPVNVYRNCLKRYLICGYIVPNAISLKKHGFELKFLFSIFSKLNQIKINKTGVKLQAYVTLEILCSPWIQSKIRPNVYENIKIWK